MILTSHQIFSDVECKNNLANKAVNSGIITIIEQVIRLLLQVVSTSVLARHITPDSYGLVSMVAVVTNFVTIFKDVGLSIITIQKEKITESEASNLFWINVALSVALGIIVVLISPAVSWFYERSELTLITIFMGVSLTISGLSIQHQALLKRHLRFDSILVINLASYFVSVVVMVIMAVCGYEYITLVVGTLVQNILMVLITFYYCRWMPKKYDKSTKINSMVKFGVNVTTFEFVNYFTRNLDNILIGKFWGSAALGLYSKAYQIVYLPINNIRNPINSVAMPVMSRAASDAERFRKYFKMQTVILSIIVIPLMTGMFVNAHDIILLLFGPDWINMEFVFKVLALVATFQPVFGARGAAFMSLGRSDLYLKTGLLGSFCVIVSFIIGVNFGIEGVAIAYACSSVATQFVTFPFLFRNSSVKLADLMEGMLPTTLSAFCAALVSIMLSKNIVIENLFFSIVFGFVVLYVVFLALMLIIPKGREQLMYLLSLLLGWFKSFRRRKNG